MLHLLYCVFTGNEQVLYHMSIELGLDFDTARQYKIEVCVSWLWQ